MPCGRCTDTVTETGDKAQQEANMKEFNDDFFVAKAAHECANSNNLPVNVTKDTYTFYNAKNESPIIVKTDTNLNESVLIYRA
mgnify:CR=1 FL=1